MACYLIKIEFNFFCQCAGPDRGLFRQAYQGLNVSCCNVQKRGREREAPTSGYRTAALLLVHPISGSGSEYPYYGGSGPEYPCTVAALAPSVKHDFKNACPAHFIISYVSCYTVYTHLTYPIKLCPQNSPPKKLLVVHR